MFLQMVRILMSSLWGVGLEVRVPAPVVVIIAIFEGALAALPVWMVQFQVLSPDRVRRHETSLVAAAVSCLQRRLNALRLLTRQST